MTAHTIFQIVAIVLCLAILLVLPADAQDAPIPPVSGIACLPDTHDISGCDDKVFMPMVAVTPVTGEGGSGILPVRNQEREARG